MQLVVVALVVPWLLLLSQTPAYPEVRQAGAWRAAWPLKCLTGHPNDLTVLIGQLLPYAPWLLGLLALSAVGLFWYYRPSTPARPRADIS